MGAAATVFTKALLSGIDAAAAVSEFDDVPDIDTLPFKEAVAYLKKRDVVGKADYYALNDKMKFRAFTASRVADGDLLKRINGALQQNEADGGTLRDFLKLTKDDLLDKVGMGPNAGWYWETVYRTNMQTAYNVGRAIEFEMFPPLALELVVIDDTRTSDVCRPYVAQRVVLPYKDGFWQTHWPPLHFNCRSTVRGIYDEDELPETFVHPETDSRIPNGFGRYPLADDSWWQELAGQMRRAVEYGVQGEIEKARELLIRDIEQDRKTGRSVGAMARRFYVAVGKPVHIDDTPSWIIKEGTDVTGVKVIAEGKAIRDVNRLIKNYPLGNKNLTKAQDWYKVRGTAMLYNTETKEEMKAEVHWYQCKNVGKVEFKFKRKIR